MIVRPYDGTPPELQPVPDIPPERLRLRFTPFRTVPLGHSQELRIDLTESANARAVSARFYKSKGRGRPLEPERPMHVFPEYLPALIAALTDAAAAIGAPLKTEENPCADA